MVDKPRSVPQISVNIERPDNLRPEVASFFQLNRLGPDIVLSVGYVSIPDAIAQLKKDNPEVDSVVQGTVTHDFQMSAAVFALLQTRVNEFAERMQKSGITLPPIPPDTTA